MHEMSVCKEIMDICIKYSDKLEKITDITLSIGIYASISISQLKYCFEVRKINTIFNDCNLIIKRSKGVRFCNYCNENYFFNLKNDKCPKCGNVSSNIISGYEMKILSIEGV